MVRVTHRDLMIIVRRALHEDRVRSDITSRSLIPASARGRATIITRHPGRLAGLEPAVLAFRVVDPTLRCRVRRRDGARLRAGEVILTVEGRVRSILAAQRTALNFLGHLSGVSPPDMPGCLLDPG